MASDSTLKSLDDIYRSVYKYKYLDSIERKRGFRYDNLKRDPTGDEVQLRFASYANLVATSPGYWYLPMDSGESAAPIWNEYGEVAP